MESRISVEEPETTTGVGVGSERAYEQPAPRVTVVFERRMRPWRDALLRRMLALADVTTALLVSLSLALFPGGTVVEALWSAVFVPVWVLLAKLAGLYDRDQRSLRHLTVDELPAIFAWALCGTASMGLFLWGTPAGAPELPVAIRCGIVAVVAAIVLRALARFSWRRIVPPERTVIVGADALADEVRRKLELFPDIHVDVVDQLDDASLGGLPDTPPALTGVDRVILASRSVDETLIAGLLTFCREQKVKLSMVPPARGMFGTAVRLNHVADLPVLEYNTWDVSRSTLFLKRTIDVCVASLLLAVLAPVFLLIALAVRLDSRGPVFFSQVRAGRDARPFRMIKFRTMCADAEEQLPQLVPFDSLRDPMFKLRNDPRVTRVGRFLRRTSLDELPQLWNVLRGTMSLVGPRPEQIDLVERYRPEHRFRLVMRPGLTGPMQVFGRGELTFEERLAVEREYIENLSLGRDFRILAMTVVPVVSGRGAF
jgi:exopolysaccharide biosynthesis polyprenyl glycosylphosphotransferase